MHLNVTVTDRPGLPFPVIVQISTKDRVIAQKGFECLGDAVVPDNWINCGGPIRDTQEDRELFAKCFEHTMNVMDRYHHFCS